MIKLIALVASMFHPAPRVAQFQPCVWPNRCASVAIIGPCGPGHVCAQVAQFETCVWPKTCSKRA